MKENSAFAPWALCLALAVAMVVLAACTETAGGGGGDSSSSAGGSSVYRPSSVAKDNNIVGSFSLTLGEPFGTYIQNFTIDVQFIGNPNNEDLNPDNGGKGLDSVRIRINNQENIHVWKGSESNKQLNFSYNETFNIEPVDKYCGREYPICVEVYALGKSVGLGDACKNFNRDVSRCTIPSSSSEQSSSSADTRRFERVGGDIELTKTDKCVKLSEGQAASTGDICIDNPKDNKFVAKGSASISVEFADGSGRYAEIIPNPSTLADFPLRTATSVWSKDEIYRNYGSYYVICTNGKPDVAEWNNSCYLMLPEGVLDMELGTGVTVKVWKVQ